MNPLLFKYLPESVLNKNIFYLMLLEITFIVLIVLHCRISHVKYFCKIVTHALCIIHMHSSRKHMICIWCMHYVVVLQWHFIHKREKAINDIVYLSLHSLDFINVIVFQIFKHFQWIIQFSDDELNMKQIAYEFDIWMDGFYFIA